MLTFKPGFRWYFASLPVERFDRINAGFNPTATNSVNALIDRKSYPATPTLFGGLLFAGVNGGLSGAAILVHFLNVAGHQNPTLWRWRD